MATAFGLAMHPAGWLDPCTAQLQDSQCAVGWINDPSQVFSHRPPAYPRWVHVGIVLQLSFEEAWPLPLLFWGENPVGVMDAKEAVRSPLKDALPMTWLGACSL